MVHKFFHWKFGSKLHDYDKENGPPMTLYGWGSSIFFLIVYPIGSVLVALEQEGSRFTFLQI